MSGALTPVLMADSAARWRLQAVVPVICTVGDVSRDSLAPALLIVKANCNAERYAVLLRSGARSVEVTSARSTLGQAVVQGGQVRILSNQPGSSVIIIELAGPIPSDQISVALQPLQ